MHALNIKQRDIQGQTKLVFNFYKNSLEDIIDSNIDKKVSSKNNFLQPLKSIALVF